MQTLEQAQTQPKLLGLPLKAGHHMRNVAVSQTIKIPS